jgi:hypothetical protein
MLVSFCMCVCEYWGDARFLSCVIHVFWVNNQFVYICRWISQDLFHFGTQSRRTLVSPSLPLIWILWEPLRWPRFSVRWDSPVYVLPNCCSVSPAGYRYPYSRSQSALWQLAVRMFEFLFCSVLKAPSSQSI